MSVPINILFVEDSENDCDLLVHHLRENGYDPKFERIETETEMNQALEKSKFDIILCDHSLPDFDLFSALSIAKVKLPNAPFIIVSGTVSECVAVKALKLGARDYILKNNLSRFVPSISRELAEVKAHAQQVLLKAELKNKEGELRQAQKLEAIGQLAGGIAHDFNNILAVIFMQAEIGLESLEKDPQLKKQAESVFSNLELIKKTGERAANLTRQLLAFSRKQLVYLKVLNINEVILDLEKMLSRIVEENVNLVLELDKNCQNIKIDQGHLEQILINLVVNSRDAMGAGGDVVITTENEFITPEMEIIFNVPTGNYVVLKVADEGCGISEQNLTRIFEPFFTTKGVGKGTGLGLSTVYGITKQNNGYIRVESVIGQGTVFSLYFSPSTEQLVRDPASTEPRDLKGSETILVVEDDAGLKSAICETLARYGYKVIDANNGEEAFEVIKLLKGKIDLVITDVLMPKMGGIELSEKSKTVDFKSQFLFLSGYSEDKVLQQSVSSGRAHFIQKPFKITLLLNKIRQILETE